MLYEDWIFDKKSALNIIVTQDSQEAKVMANKEGASQTEHAVSTIIHIKPDYEEMQTSLGWMKGFNEEPRPKQLATDTISL